MTMKRFVGAALAMAGLLVLASCASTRLQAEWKSDASKGYRIGKIFVIGVSDRERARKSFEDEFVRRFKDNGVEASPSYPVLGSETKPDKNMVLAAVTGKGYDTILVTRLVGLDKKTMHVSGTNYEVPHPDYHQFSGYYSMTYGMVHQPSYTIDYDVLKLETNLYEVESEKLLYTILSKSFDAGRTDEVLKDLSRAVMERLQKDGLF